MSLPATQRPAWPDRLPAGRSDGLVLARTQQDLVAEIARRASHAAEDYADYAHDHLRLASLAARVPAPLQAQAQALIAMSVNADLSSLARLYRRGTLH